MSNTVQISMSPQAFGWHTAPVVVHSQLCEQSSVTNVSFSCVEKDDQGVQCFLPSFWDLYCTHLPYSSDPGTCIRTGWKAHIRFRSEQNQVHTDIPPHTLSAHTLTGLPGLRRTPGMASYRWNSYCLAHIPELKADTQSKIRVSITCIICFTYISLHFACNFVF